MAACGLLEGDLDFAPDATRSISQVHRATEFVGNEVRITLVPYPSCAGTTAGGPPLSCHSIKSSGSGLPLRRRSQRTDTLPFAVDSAPYFAALVTSSWSTIATT